MSMNGMDMRRGQISGTNSENKKELVGGLGKPRAKLP